MQPLKQRKIDAGVHGRYMLQVVEKGEPKFSTDFKDNYIFNWGLDIIGNGTVFADVFKYCHISKQSNPSESSGLLNPQLQDQNIANYKISNNYYGGRVRAPYDFSGCGSIDIGSGVKMRRTFDFPEESSNTQYTEIGWSPLNSVGSNLWSRIVTTSGTGHVPVVVLEGQSIRVIYELDVILQPSPSPLANPVTGWNSTGTFGVQLYGISCVASGNQLSGTVGKEASVGTPSWSAGATIFWDHASGANEPSLSGFGFLSAASQPLSSIGTGTDRSTGTYDFGGSIAYESPLQMKTYTNGTYQRQKRFFVPSSSGVHNGYRCFGIGGGYSGSQIRPQGDGSKYNTLVHLFDNNVNKEDEYIFNGNVTFSWSRA